MAPWVDIPLATGEGEARAGFVSDAELTNLMIETTPPGSRAPFAVVSTPGLSESTFSGSGVLRGMIVAQGYLWYVRGTSVYYFDGTTHTLVPIGTMPDNGYCRMVDAGTHIVMVDGTNARATTIAQVFSCSRGNFSDVSYQDGYTIYVETGTNSLYVSSIDDPTTIGALDFTTVDALPGDAIAVVSDHREVVVFSEGHAEFYYNAGGSGFPFVRSSPGVTERGIYAVATLAKYDNRLFWVGNDRRVYSMHGYQPVPISTPWVDRILQTAGNLSSTTAGGVIVLDGRAYYWVSCDFLAASAFTLVYDIGIGLWHKRTDDSTGTTQWRSAATHVISTSDITYVSVLSVDGLGTDGVARLLRTVHQSMGATISRVLTCPAVTAGGVRGFMPEVYLDQEKATAASTINMTFSDDGGTTYSGNKAADGTLIRARWQRLGSFFHRILRFTFSTNSRVSIFGIRARVERGAA